MTWCFNEIFERQARRSPERCAVVCGQQQITYAMLDTQANKLARHLCRQGVGRGAFVAIYMDRSIEAIIALLGIVKAGAAYVPFDVDLPQERLDLQLTDITGSLVLTQEHLLSRLNHHNNRVVCLEAVLTAAQPQQHATDPPDQIPAPYDTLYVVYTSGSTGVPKGALISHRNAVNYTLSICERLHLSNTHYLTFAHISSLATDIGNTCLFPSLVTGGTLHLIEAAVARDAELFASYMTRQSIDVCKITPSHLNALLTIRQPERVLPRAHLILGGEAFSLDLYERIASFSPSCRIWNHYGPTETTVGVLCTEARQRNLWPSLASTVPIGTPIANVQAYILDAGLNPVSPGAPGELYIGGACVGDGYLGRPELTAQSFVPDPSPHASGGRLYKTGDLCRLLSDGAIEFLGRVDRQVKIKGFRVEPEEIETALRMHPAVENAAVLVAGSATHRRLAAYIVAHEHTGADGRPIHERLRHFLQQRLPTFMIPSEFFFLDQFAHTPSGKIDYKALPTRASSATSGVTDRRETAPTAPTNDTDEQRIARAWQKYLDATDISISDTYFGLGGDSITAIQISAELHTQGIAISPQQIIDNQTIAAQARAARTQVLTRAQPHRGTPRSAPLTPIQQWFFEQRFPQPHHWNQAVLFDVQDQLEPELLAEALRRLVLHHDALHLRFQQTDDTWEQIAQDMPPVISVRGIHVGGLNAQEQDVAYARDTAAAQTGLNLWTGPLINGTLFDVGSAHSSKLLLVAHHAVIDGVSWRLLIDDLQRTYEQLRLRMPTRLPNKTTPFQEWSIILHRLAGQHFFADELPYWRNMIGQVTSGLLPRDGGGAAGSNLEGSTATIWCTLTHDDTNLLLRRLSSSARVHDILLCALARAVCRWATVPSFLVDIEGHGREHLIDGIDLTRTIGWFTAQFPHVLQARRNEPFDATLAVTRTMLERVPRRGIGFGALRYLGPHNSVHDEMALWPQADICFNYYGQFSQIASSTLGWTPSAILPSATRDPGSQRSHALRLTSRIIDNRLQLEWAYSRNVHQDATMTQLVHLYVDELLAYLVDTTPKSASVGITATAPLPTWDASWSGLPLAVAPDAGPSPLRESSCRAALVPSLPANILLTGATGFLGVHILRGLLHETDAHIYCLTRAPGADIAQARLLEQLRWYFPLDDYQEVLTRIHAVPGDICLQRLGMNVKEHRTLCTIIDQVFHVAADVRLIGNAQDLWSTNVTGTRHIVEFAAAGKDKCLQYISTLSVAGEPTDAETTIFGEDDFAIRQRFRNPYEQSKYEAERVVRQFIAAGGRATIYRSSDIAADSHMGRFQRNIARNRLYLSVQAMLEHGIAPYLPHVQLRFSYVDVVARGIVRLSQQHESIAQTYHVDNVHTLSHYDFIRCLHSFGYPILVLDPDDFKIEVERLGNAREYLFGLTDTWGDLPTNQGTTSIVYDCTRSVKHLRQLNVTFDAPSTGWLYRVIAHCISVGFLMAPPRWTETRNLPDVLDRGELAYVTSELES